MLRNASLKFRGCNHPQRRSSSRNSSSSVEILQTVKLSAAAAALSIVTVTSSAFAADAAKGAPLYAQRCAMCHGRNAQSGGSLADLRYATPATYDIFQNIVREGAYSGLGMPNLGEYLSEQDADSIKQFILSRRAALMAQ